MLQSPSSYGLGTPHHLMDEDHMINPQAQARQLNQGQDMRLFGGMTPQNLLGSGQTPHSLLNSTGQTPHSLLNSPAVHNMEPQSCHVNNVYAPVVHAVPPSPMPPTPINVQHSVASVGAPLEPGIVPQLQNIVSTVNLVCPLDLKRIALNARNAEYNPKRFAAVIMRIRDPRTTALIFRYKSWYNQNVNFCVKFQVI